MPDVYKRQLDEPDLRLKEVKVEQVVLNKSGKRAIRLDAWARDEQNRHINTEMQNDAKQDNLRKRSRFYQGLLDTPVLKSGKKTKYKHLPSTIIIFITRDDIFRCDSAMYLSLIHIFLRMPCIYSLWLIKSIIPGLTVCQCP